MSVEKVLYAWSNLLGAHRVEKAQHGDAWMIYTENHSHFVLKRQVRLSFVDALQRIPEEHRLLTYLADRGFPVAVPLPADDGRMFTEVAGDIYLLSPMLPASDGERTAAEHREIGAIAAELHLALAAYPFEITSWTIDLAGHTFGAVVDGLRTQLPEDDFAAVVRHVRSRQDEMTAAFHDLPTQRVHGDWHGANILMAGGQISGLVDLDHPADRTAGVRPRLLLVVGVELDDPPTRSRAGSGSRNDCRRSARYRRIPPGEPAVGTRDRGRRADHVRRPAHVDELDPA